MKLLRSALVVVAAVVSALVPLLMLDGPRRANGYRVFTVALGLLALRAVYRFAAASPSMPTSSPFRRPRRLHPTVARAASRTWRLLTRRPKAPVERTGLTALLIGAEERAGHFHFRLRPMLRDIADERLRSHHGIGVDEPAAADILGPVAWDHLRPDRTAPADRRADGPSATVLEHLIERVEAV